MIECLLRVKRKITGCSDLVILCYHRVCEPTGLFYDRNISATPEQFRKQVKYLKSHFSVIDLSGLLACHSGREKLKPNSLMITFDDGYKDNVLNAFPVLKEYGMSTVVFPTMAYIETDYVPWEDKVAYLLSVLESDQVKVADGKSYQLGSHDEKVNSIWHYCKGLRGVRPHDRDELILRLYNEYGVDIGDVQSKAAEMNRGYMTEEDIRYWSHEGIEFGCHTMTHPRISMLDDDELLYEIEESKRCIERMTERSVNIFAYPFGFEGDYNESNKAMLKNLGINAAMSLNVGVNNAKSDPMELKRIGVGPGVNFKNVCHGVSA